jgi:hypothetical protein
MGASEFRYLAARARIGSGTSVLHPCRGVAGPARLLVAVRRCRYLGLDLSTSAVGIARDIAGPLPCRFEQADVPPLPDARFEIALLLETMLAFPDKGTLFSEVARVLIPGGRFACTVEEGRPLTLKERAEMPDADTVWLIRLGDVTSFARGRGLERDVAAAGHRDAGGDGSGATAVVSHSCGGNHPSDRDQGVQRVECAHQQWSDGLDGCAGSHWWRRSDDGCRFLLVLCAGSKRSQDLRPVDPHSWPRD